MPIFSATFTEKYGYQMRTLGTRVPKIPMVTEESDQTVRFCRYIVTMRGGFLDNGNTWRLDKLGGEVLIAFEATGPVRAQFRC